MCKKTIMLACGLGMSTNILVEKMKKIIADQNIEYEVLASTTAQVEGIINKQPIDVLLLGPQVAYMANRLAEKYASQGVRVGVIDKDDYGLARARRVLDLAENLLKDG
ncbi:PTS sugar transporter subunit IIB [Facklamia sp. DSM 111018]|uniref:PTS sugar transporter subunit IIB n=1 Tax=Facklamia lactis TaxID=2749967 RepID=A0ABS0LQU1_9LACT|nr:PTS sugar transporter subunit IIB [Facklamia lactis]MBG9980716.1 PTS sugar transporter subunit IIB [Facklamia lactis]MBG9986530.1 PTS sugar transporter subunit IIB [Facklamia lactis]